jgi:thiol-disulfide isomerase/thioredoxin
MKRIRTAALALSACITLGAFSPLGALAAAQTAPARAGGPSALPEFSLPDLDGKAHTPKEWSGKVVVMDFWATWCVGCRETVPVLKRLHEKFGDGLVVVGVSLDKAPKEKIAKFTRKVKMDYNVLWDADDTLSKVFGFEGLPSVYVFGRDGKLLKAMPQYTAAQEKEMEALVEGQFQGK